MHGLNLSYLTTLSFTEDMHTVFARSSLIIYPREVDIACATKNKAM